MSLFGIAVKLLGESGGLHLSDLSRITVVNANASVGGLVITYVKDGTEYHVAGFSPDNVKKFDMILS